MKLQLLPKDAKAEALANAKTPLDVEIALIKEAFKNPIGWWDVTTEGDIEGRSTKKIGTFYGHIAEIAFHIGDQCCYSLSFNPVLHTSAPADRPFYRVTTNKVWIQLGIKSGTWDMSCDTRAEHIRKLFDCDDEITVLPRTKNATYYASVFIMLKDDLTKKEPLFKKGDWVTPSQDFENLYSGQGYQVQKDCLWDDGAMVWEPLVVKVNGKNTEIADKMRDLFKKID